MEFTAELIAGYLGGEIAGDPKAVVTKLAKSKKEKQARSLFWPTRNTSIISTIRKRRS